jgi:hypothetical protein
MSPRRTHSRPLQIHSTRGTKRHGTSKTQSPAVPRCAPAPPAGTRYSGPASACARGDPRGGSSARPAPPGRPPARRLAGVLSSYCTC